VFFDHDKGKSHSSGKLLFAARIIPYRGSWLDIEFDPRTSSMRASTGRKISGFVAVFALGLDAEEILSTFYRKVIYTRPGRLARAVRRRSMKASRRRSISSTRTAANRGRDGRS